MIRVFVDHDLIASPVPVRDDVVIEGGDVPIETAKPEAFPVSSRKVEYMLRSEAAAEMPVCPGLSEAVMRIVGATIMAYPSIVLSIHVRNVRMAWFVHFHMVLGRRLLALGRGRGARRLGSRCRSGSVSRDVSAANGGMTAAV